MGLVRRFLGFSGGGYGVALPASGVGPGRTSAEFGIELVN
jgi:hypothetical protein